jgi:pimeloyl-ACP methyl ester carboxylesterase
MGGTQLQGAGPPRPPSEGVEGTYIYYLGISPFGGDIGFLTLKKGPKGAFSASFENPQRRTTQNFMFVTVKDDKVEIKEYGLVSIFEGKLVKGGAYIDGKVQMGGKWQPLRFLRFRDKRPTFPRPQEPKKPYPYVEEDVTFDAGKPAVKLAGSLTLPRDSKGPHPAVVLLSGSGPVDRNSFASGHLPFLVLSDYLTRRGVAVLRVDSRGIGKSGGKIGLATTHERVQDVDGALAFLRKRKDIDPKRIGLIGHSEGGAVAALAASRDREIAWIVMLGGPGVPGERLMLRQTEMGWKSLKSFGLNDAFVEFQIGLQKKVIEALKHTDADGADKALKGLIADTRAKLTAEGRKRMGVGPAFDVTLVGSPRWLHHFVTFDPRPSLKKVRCPVLALNGDKDLIVWSKDNLPEIEKALKAGGNRNYTVKELPGINHMFQACESGRPLEYVGIDETIAPSVLKLVGDWIDKQKGAEFSVKAK